MSKCRLLASDGELRGRVERVADGQRLGGRDETLHERVVEGGVHEQPRPGQADLAGVAEDRLDRPVDGVVDVGVLEDDVRALAAELERDRREVRRRRRHDVLAGGRAPGEGHPVDPVVTGERRARRCPVAVDDVEHAGREAGLDRQAAEQGHGCRGVLARLDDAGVAPRDRRRDLPRRHHQREVPRADRRDDTGRAELAVGVVAGVHRVDLADGVALVVGEEPEVPHRAGDVVLGLQERLAHVRGVHRGQVVGALLHEVGEPVDRGGPLDAAHPRPGPLVEGAARALDRALGILLGRLGGLRPHLARPGVPDVEALAVDRLDLFVVDDVAEELQLAHGFTFCGAVVVWIRWDAGVPAQGCRAGRVPRGARRW